MTGKETLRSPALPWWQNGVIYQIYPRSFRDTNGDGTGDLAGVIEKLDYLSETLGVDGIWFSPFYPSPMRDFGYDIANYTDVDPLFGDLTVVDELIREAHARSVRVIIDYVPNHSSDEHSWFRESRSSCDNPKRDWYYWRDPKPDGSPPNNWIEETGGAVWEWDEATEQYYLHSHFASQPDLNWRNPAVRTAMFAVLRFWLDRGVDGFRVDVPHLIMKDPELRDNPVNPRPVANPYDRQHPAFHTQLHLHDRQHPDLHGVFRDMRRLVDSYDGDRVLIGEIEVAPWETWRLYFGEQLDEFHVPFNFQLIETPWDAGAIRASVEALEAALPLGAWPNYVLGNHDRPRLATRYGPEKARVAAMLLLCLRGTPTLYYGDELGMQDTVIPAERLQDPLGRDGSRTPMPWHAGSHAGFCAADVETWLPLAVDHRTINVAGQQADDRSLLNLYRQLLACRKASTPLHQGSYRSLDVGSAECYAFLREADDQRLLVVLNFSSQERTLAVPSFPAGRIVLSTCLDRGGIVDITGLSLRGDEGMIIDLGNVTTTDVHSRLNSA